MPTDKKIKADRFVGRFQKRRRIRGKDWPVGMVRTEVRWFPASSRLIWLVRANIDKFVLPPAVVRKAAWRE